MTAFGADSKHPWVCWCWLSWDKETDAELETVKTCQLMKHIVVLIGELVYLSALHPPQLAIDDGCENVPDGDDGRGGIMCGWRLRAASFGFGYASRLRRILACRRCIEVLQLVLFVLHLLTKEAACG